MNPDLHQQQQRDYARTHRNREELGFGPGEDGHPSRRLITPTRIDDAQAVADGCLDAWMLGIFFILGPRTTRCPPLIRNGPLSRSPISFVGVAMMGGKREERQDELPSTTGSASQGLARQ